MAEAGRAMRGERNAMAPMIGPMMAARAGELIRTAATLLPVLLLCLLLAPAAAQAQSQGGDEPYTVSGIPVDASADNAAAARGRAIATGQREAFAKLIERLVPAGERGSIPQLTDPEISRLVLGFEVANERSSATRYIADLTVAFSKPDVTALLRRSGTTFTAGSSQPVLIVPVYETGGRRVLWEEPNPWRTAWYSAPSGGLVPTVVPFGDITDIRDLSTAQALATDQEALQALAKRYNAVGAAVVTAKPMQGGKAQVTVQRVDPSGIGATVVETVDMGEGVVEADRLKAVVLRTRSILEEEWRQTNLVQPSVETLVSVLVPIDSMERWVNIRQTLDRINVVPRYEVRQLNREIAAVDLYLNTPVQQANPALGRYSLELMDTPEGMVLRQFGQVVPFAPGGPAPVAPGTPAPIDSQIDPATGAGSGQQQTPGAGPIVVPPTSSTGG